MNFNDSCPEVSFGFCSVYIPYAAKFILQKTNYIYW